VKHRKQAVAEEANAKNRFKRFCQKWAMVGFKGGLCVSCGERVTHNNITTFHFDHKVEINNSYDLSDRWTAIREIAPFTDKWFAWANSVNLICQDCHIARHRNGNTPPPTLFDHVSNIDLQQRLTQHDPGPQLKTQPTLL